MRFVRNFLHFPAVKEFRKSVRLRFDGVIVMSLVHSFLVHNVYVQYNTVQCNTRSVGRNSTRLYESYCRNAIQSHA